MATEDEGGAPLGPRFFEGRVLIELLSWDWALYVGLSRIGPRKHRFQGGLDLVRSIELEGRVLAPEQHRAHDIRVDVSPFGPDIRFSPRGLNWVGRFERPNPAWPGGYRASLLLPEAELAMLGIALSNTTKYLHIWTSGLEVDVATITSYSLSSTIPPKVKPWAGVD